MENEYTAGESFKCTKVGSSKQNCSHHETNEENDGKSNAGAEYVAMKENIEKYLANPRDGRKTGSYPKAGGQEQRWTATH